MKKNTKLAYFLRGLGFGIVFVTAVVGISGNNKDTKGDTTNTVTKEMTREEFIEKAKEIGMVEGVDMKLDAILDATATPEASAVAEKQEAESATAEPTKAPVKTKSPGQTEAPTKTETPAKTGVPAMTVEDGKKLFTIKEGQPATEVVRELVKAGLVDDEKEFHKFLQENDYLTKIIAGDHKITIDASYKTIAKELCGYQK
ncbi:MAG: hypothetical protein Q4F05_14600 [bacterium]|nr:hypothetical protein [bacterium]